MATSTALLPSAQTRERVRDRGGASVASCYQCGTCSSVCDLATNGSSFPRRQVLLAQWGLGDRLIRDPGVWLCHGCDDCTLRCPRDAKPGDVLQAARALGVEEHAAPRFMGRLTGMARATWPLLVGIPILFWVLAYFFLAPLAADYSTPQALRGAEAYGFHNVIPHVLIYAVFFPIAAFVTAALYIGGKRFWASMNGADQRKGTFLLHLVGTLIEILLHRRFASCGSSSSRRWSHLALVFGFIGAAVTSGLLIAHIYITHTEMPLGVWHPTKILGNLSALLLIVGAAMLLYDRLFKSDRTGTTTAFDMFFLGVVFLVIVTGTLAEVARLSLDPVVAVWVYIVHLGTVTTLFLTSPYSKFAHFLYRTLAMVHERMVGAEQPDTSGAGAQARSVPHPIH
ncbi:MAG: quinone-interacting membrane-bound oxidoreductase complex subunit QmoC [Planctomycetota bacterium]